jgi:hypothetical protein
MVRKGLIAILFIPAALGLLVLNATDPNEWGPNETLCWEGGCYLSSVTDITYSVMTGWVSLLPYNDEALDRFCVYAGEGKPPGACRPFNPGSMFYPFGMTTILPTYHRNEE